MKVSWEPGHDVNFKAQYEVDLQEWVTHNTTFNVEIGGEHTWTTTDITFDEALVLNGLHPTTSSADPNEAKHVTVRLSTPELRANNAWYTLHWRPGDGSVVLPRPNNETSRTAKRARAKAKKDRRRARNHGKTVQSNPDKDRENEGDGDEKGASKPSRSN